MHRFKGRKLVMRKGYICLGHKPVHRIIWEEDIGPIPEGFDVHHKDGNKYNNLVDNLECLTKSDHMRLHAKERRWALSVTMSSNSEKIHKWHRSKKGRLSLSNKAKKQCENREFRSFVCQVCKKDFQSNHNTNPKYCSDNCVQSARLKSGIDNEERNCRICDTKFTINKYQNTQVCSMKCRNLWLKEKRNNRPLFDCICDDCGTSYKAQHPKRSRFCSKTCSQRFRLRSKRKP